MMPITPEEAQRLINETYVRPKRVGKGVRPPPPTVSIREINFFLFSTRGSTYDNDNVSNQDERIPCSICEGSYRKGYKRQHILSSQHKRAVQQRTVGSNADYFTSLRAKVPLCLIRIIIINIINIVVISTHFGLVDNKFVARSTSSRTGGTTGPLRTTLTTTTATLICEIFIGIRRRIRVNLTYDHLKDTIRAQSAVGYNLNYIRCTPNLSLDR